MATTNIYEMVDTWNDGAVVFTAIGMNVTDTASDVDDEGRPVMEERFETGRVAFTLLSLVINNPKGSPPEEIVRMLNVRDDIRKAIMEHKDFITVDETSWASLKRRVEEDNFTIVGDTNSVLIDSVRNAEEVELSVLEKDNDDTKTKTKTKTKAKVVE